MSKKLSELDRYERMRKMEKEAEAERRKSDFEGRKKTGKPKMSIHSQTKCRIRDFDEYMDY